MSESADRDAREWFGSRTYHHARFGDAEELLRAKRDRGLTISVCLPTRNEAGTIGPILRSIRGTLMVDVPLVDELVILDSASTDGTTQIALDEGAVVHQDRDVCPELEPLGGKGDALWKSLFVLKGDLIAFADADILNFGPHFVTGLLGPLLMDPGLRYAKAFYQRPLQGVDGLHSNGGGRVTELVVRPLINLFFPSLAAVVQPLAGEYAGTREALESVPFFTGYGVELGLLVDVVERFGLGAVAQVDLEERVHRNRSTAELSRMAFGILQAAFLRLSSMGRVTLGAEMRRELFQFVTHLGEYRIEPAAIEVFERPPAVTFPGYPGPGPSGRR